MALCLKTDMDFTEKLETVKGDPVIPLRKISFHGSIQKDMLGENCPEATPTPEDSDLPFIEQGGIPWENLAPVQPESSVQICPFGKPPSSSCEGDCWGEFFDDMNYSSDSDSRSGSESSAW